MNNITYTVVTLDGKEKRNVSFDEIKDLFFRRQINQSSLINSSENPQWQMLKRVFDLSQWVPANAAPAPSSANFPLAAQPPQQNPFEQQNSFNQQSSSNQPVTFNQFPPNQSNQPNYNAPNQSNGYTQNNQSHSYFQAETPQNQYNYQNTQSNYSSGNYNNSQSNYNNPANNYNYSPVYQIGNPDDRNGVRHAAIFLIVNAIFYVFYMIAGNFLIPSEGGGTPAYNAGRSTGKYLFPLILILIDISLAIKLWKKDNIESTRKRVLALRYFGFIICGIIVPLIFFGLGNILAGAFIFIWSFFYFISYALVLHGKENPTPSRVMVGIGTFAIYFLMMFGMLALSSVAMLAPNLAQFDIPDTQFEKYKIEGKEYQDSTTGAKVSLPEGWTMISTSNPVMSSPQARMIAVGKKTQSMTMLEIVPVPANLDIKTTNSNELLDFLTDYVSKNMAEELKNSNPGLRNVTAKEITRMSISVGNHPAKLLVMETSMNYQKYRSHLIITFDELSMYILHSWCPVEKYDIAKDEFYALEKSFTIPDQINSPFTQTSETEKNKAASKSNF